MDAMPSSILWARKMPLQMDITEIKLDEIAVAIPTQLGQLNSTS